MKKLEFNGNIAAANMLIATFCVGMSESKDNVELLKKNKEYIEDIDFEEGSLWEAYFLALPFSRPMITAIGWEEEDEDEYYSVFPDVEEILKKAVPSGTKKSSTDYDEDPLVMFDSATKTGDATWLKENVFHWSKELGEMFDKYFKRAFGRKPSYVES